MGRAGRARSSVVAFAALAAVALGVACETESRPRAKAPPPGYYPPPPGAYPPGYPGQYPPGQYPPGQYPPQGLPPGPGPQPTATPGPGPYDPINATDIAWLRARAQGLLKELIAALPAAAQQRVQGVPLVIDDTPGEVNAFAACVNGQAVMAITDGLLDIMAHLAAARASDELFGTKKVDEYVALVATSMRQGQGIARPAPGFYNPAQEGDARKNARQVEVLDEQLAFVLGHEAAHHHLGHLGCTGGSNVGPGDVVRVLSNAVPLFNQPNELAADVAGTNNLLTAGARRQAARLTEGGGMLSMQFFAGVDQLTPSAVFDFERTHPPPAIRIPVIQQAANTWRFTGGIGIPMPGF